MMKWQNVQHFFSGFDHANLVSSRNMFTGYIDMQLGNVNMLVDNVDMIL